MSFAAVYSKESMIPPNPIKEIDEFYCKDEKVPEQELDKIALGHLKELEDKKF